VSEHIDDQNRDFAGGRGDESGRYAECAYVQDLAAGFALGAIDSEDQQSVLDHIAACPPCRLLINQSKQTAAMLPFSTPTATPPLHAKAALFSRIAQSSRTNAAELPAPSTTIPASNAGVTPAPPPNHRWRLPQFGRPNSSHSSRFYLPLLATVPLVIALALVGGLAMTSQADVDDLRAQLLSTRQDLNDTQDSLDTVDEFVAQSNTVVYELPGQDGASSGSAHGTVFANPGTNEAVLLVSGLDAKPKDCRYEVWLQGRDGFMVRAAEFGVDDEGRNAVKLALDQPFNNFMTLHVRRTLDGADIINSEVPAGDAIYANIGPNVGEIFDQVGTERE
jgi:Anti-sigma-K factor rskA/Putative zinc-finger